MSTIASYADEKRRRKTIQRIVAILFVVSSLVSVFWLRQIPKGTTQSLFVALIPIPFLLLSLATILWTTRMCDELMRKIQFEALAFALASLFAVIELAMLVQLAGFWKGFGTAETMIALCVLYMIGMGLAWNRYR
jgi:hypothetical protein